MMKSLAHLGYPLTFQIAWCKQARRSLLCPPCAGLVKFKEWAYVGLGSHSQRLLLPFLSGDGLFGNA